MINYFSKELLIAGKIYYTITATATGGTTVTFTGNSQTGYNSLTVPKDTVVNYSIPAYGSASSKSGSITMNSNKTLTATYASGTSYTEGSWSQPSISSNGTLGSSSFAVSASNEYNSSYPAWKAFDSSSSTQWLMNYNNLPGYMIFYASTPIKVSKIQMGNRSNAQGYFTGGTVYGSNSNGSWATLKSWTNSTGGSNTSYTITVSSSSYYYYHKISFTGYTRKQTGESPGSANIGITATKRISTTTYYWNVSII